MPPQAPHGRPPARHPGRVLAVLAGLLLLTPSAAAIHDDDVPNTVDIATDPTELVWHAIESTIIHSIGAAFSAVAGGILGGLGAVSHAVTSGWGDLRLAIEDSGATALEAVDTVVELLRVAVQDVADAVDSAARAAGPAAPIVHATLWVGIGVWTATVIGAAIDALATTRFLPGFLEGGR